MCVSIENSYVNWIQMYRRISIIHNTQRMPVCTICLVYVKLGSPLMETNTHNAIQYKSEIKVVNLLMWLTLWHWMVCRNITSALNKCWKQVVEKHNNRKWFVNYTSPLLISALAQYWIKHYHIKVILVSYKISIRKNYILNKTFKKGNIRMK